MTFAQNVSKDAIAKKYINQNIEKWNLTSNDVQDLYVDQYTDEHNGVTHIYFNQQYNGLKIFNAVTSVHITQDGNAYSVGNRFISNIQDKVNTTESRITPVDALQNACSFLGITNSRFVNIEKISNSEYKFNNPEFAHNDINANLMYVLTKDNKLRLVWNLPIDQKDKSDYVNLRIDAVTGKVIDQNSWTVKCNIDHSNYVHKHTCTEKVSNLLNTNPITPSKASSYRVVKFPAESPIYGLPELVVDPYNPTASPYGWHDTDGVEGAEYTITRGNNVNAYLDTLDSNNGGFQPDGGEALVFDFPFDDQAEPSELTSAAITNLFYANNFMHDFSYMYGFTEAAGNFQKNNYGNGGIAGDAVIAQAQDGAVLFDGEHLNNANFGTPPDGNRPRMQMYNWTQSNVLEILEPASVAGIYTTGSASYGPDIIEENLDITGELAIIKDGKPSLTDGCQEATNPEELDGKIVFADRGSCFFEEKTLNAQHAGAIAVIICNFADELVGMQGGIDDDEPTIPTLSMGKSTCDKLKLLIDQGLKMRIHVPQGNGPRYFDADFDNGVMAHEYAHGISNRLTGGAGNSSALTNPEQMGEGWSDYFALITTVENGDTGTDKRGVGNYLNGEGTDGIGIRRYPYSTDMSINPLTYRDVASNTEVHALGEVWTAVLWDLYWAFVDEYGFSDDLTDMTAGNNIANILIMDGMKMQPVSPGFIDGRNAILLADQLDFEDEHKCLIWKVFARRGMGYEADQGQSSSAADQTESFLHLPVCIKALKITKTFSPEVKPGDDLEYTLHIINHLDSTVSAVVVTDEIPEGCIYKDGSGSETPVINNGIISWELNNLAHGDEVTLKYTITTDGGKKSNTFYYEGFEGDEDEISDNWAAISEGKTIDGNVWELIEDFELSNNGDRFFFVSNTEKQHDERLISLNEITIQGDNPHLTFSHNYDTESTGDAGLIYLSTNEGDSWIDLGPYITHNKYTGPVKYGTFVLPFLNGFSGNSNGYITSYVDLSEFVGENVIFRWRFGSDENFAEYGWSLDDVFLTDLKNIKVRLV